MIGGSKGIGRAVVEQALSRDQNVVVIARQQRDLPAAVTFHPADILTDDFQSAIPEELDGLVYAPGSITLAPVHRLTEEQVLLDYRINAVGAMRAITAALPALKRRPGSSIVLFSTVAVQTGMPFHASIAMAKGAVEGLTRSLAAELAPTVRVNAVAPSLTDTDLAGRLLGDEKRREASAARHPLRRVGTPDEVARAAVYLLLDATWTTGSVLPADGGLGELSANN